MSVEIIFDHAIDRSPPITVGPVGSVVIGHRSMRAGWSRFLRHADGGVPVDGAETVRIRFEGPWHRASPPELAAGVVLYGDRALLEPTGSWVATDDSDGPCWVAEGTGLANRELGIAAA